MTVNPNNGKAKILRQYNTLQMEIPSQTNWVWLIISFLWLFVWGTGLIGVIREFEQSDLTNNVLGIISLIFTLFWLLAWLAVGSGIVFLLLWGFFGKETFRLEGGRVVLEKTVFGIGKKHILDKAGIKNFRLEPANAHWLGPNRWAFYGLGPGKILFDYHTKTYSFGMALDDAEARQIVDMLKEKFALTLNKSQDEYSPN